MFARRRLIFVGIGVTLAGLVSMLISSGVIWSMWTNFLAAGFGVTVPGEIELDLDPSEGEMVVWRELAGTQITVNRPLLDPPDDLRINVIDRQSGEAIATRKHDWYVQQKLMPGFERHRSALRAFDPPEHGEVTIEITGTFDHEQVYRVAPSISSHIGPLRLMIQLSLGGSLLVLLIGIGLIVAYALRQERAPLRLDDQPFA